MLTDPDHRIGSGTCIDLAVLIASCLEALDVQPLIAVVGPGNDRHALVGCWREPRDAVRLVPVRTKLSQLAGKTKWVDPNGCPIDAKARMAFAESSASAAAQLSAPKAFLFAVDVTGARRKGVTPLPFAGPVHWSHAAKAAQVEAEQCAKDHATQLATVPLLVGLLRVPDGVAQKVFAHLGDVSEITARLTAGLPKNGELPPSTNYHGALQLAQARAVEDGRSVVMDHHVLAALLSINSDPLDRALRRLGTTRTELQDRLWATLGTPPELRSHTSYSRFATPS